MQQTQDQSKKFWTDFNKVQMNRQMPPEQKVQQILALQNRIEEIPTQQARWSFLLHSNMLLCECYERLHKRYKLTPYVKECFELLNAIVRQEFATRQRNSFGYLGNCFEQEYERLAQICQSKNNQRQVAYCYHCLAKIWHHVGNSLGCARVTAICNLALSKIPNESCLTKQQLVELFPQHSGVVNQVFDGYQGLQNDPVEQSEEYIKIYDQAEQIIQQTIERQGRLARCPDQYWNVKKVVLKSQFGIEWQSPRHWNKGVRF